MTTFKNKIVDIKSKNSNIEPEVYDIYHDESKEDAYWHGFLIVPRSNRDYLLKLLRESRSNTNYHNEVSYKNIKKGTKLNHETAIIIQSWTSIGVVALQQQKLDELSTEFHLGGKEKKYINKLDNLIKCKFAVFKEKDKHKKMYDSMNELERIETTFRIGLKGGIHYLFDNNNSITIGNVYIDGDKHYIGKYGRTFDINRTLKRLQNEVKDYVYFLEDSKLIPQRSDHKKIEKNQRNEDSYLLQLCDILLGGIRFYSFCRDNKHIKSQISYACKKLLEYDQNNIARMKNSRFYNAFSLSEAWIENGEWKFNQLTVGRDKRESKGEQLDLCTNTLKIN